MSILVTERTDFENFHLRVETMMPEGLQNAIRFRMTESDGHPSSYYTTGIAGTVQLPNEKVTKTGILLFVSTPTSINLADPEPIVATKPGEWFVLEVIADGDVIKVIVGGIKSLRSRICTTS